MTKNSTMILDYYVKDLGYMIYSIAQDETGKIYKYNYYNQTSRKTTKQEVAWHLAYYRKHKDITAKQYIMNAYDLDDDAFELWLRFN